MSEEIKPPVATGMVISYSNQWNPFIWEVNVLVRVNGKMISVPIDRRQRRFIEREHPIGSMVELEHTDKWRIKSREIVFDEFLSTIHDFSDYHWETALRKTPSDGN